MRCRPMSIPGLASAAGAGSTAASRIFESRAIPVSWRPCRYLNRSDLTGWVSYDDEPVAAAEGGWQHLDDPHSSGVIVGHLNPALAGNHARKHCCAICGRWPKTARSTTSSTTRRESTKRTRHSTGWRYCSILRGLRVTLDYGLPLRAHSTWPPTTKASNARRQNLRRGLPACL